MDSIIFDVDGTLWDSTSSVAIAYNKALAAASVPTVVDAARLKQLFGKPMDVIFQELLPGFSKEDCVRIADEAMELEAIGLMEDSDELIQTYIYDGIGEMLKTLSSRYPLFIVSNCQKGYIEIFTERSGYGKYITGHLCFGDTGTSKGQTILRLMREHNLTAPVYVGDTKGDAAACKEAGIPFIHAAYGFDTVEDAEYQIDTPMDLVRFVSEYEKKA